MRGFSLVVAMDLGRGIGKDGDLPWRLKGDMQHFKAITMGGVVLMGRKTWESLPEAYKPLPGRFNVVLSRQEDYDVPEGVGLYSDLETAIDVLSERDEAIFLIGGGELYAQGLDLAACERVYATEVMGHFDCDTRFPEFGDGWECSRSSNYRVEQAGVYCFREYIPKK